MSDIISDFPIALLLIWLPISIAISIWLYRPNKDWLLEISSWKRYLMLSLRALSLFLIGVLLLGILLETLDLRKEKPIIVTLIDDSASMLNYSDSAEVKSDFTPFLARLSAELPELDFQFKLLSNNKLSLDTEEVEFDYSKSNIYNFIDDAYNQYYGRNVGGYLLLSDGNYNVGNNPLSLQNKLLKNPVFSVGIGDTVRKKDLLVRNILHNDIAFLGNKFPVEVTIEADKSKDIETKVLILKNGKEIVSQKVSFKTNQNTIKKLDFLLTAETVGFQEYEVKIEAVENESNYENNTKSFYIDVIDSRSKILLLGSGAHPDLGALRQTLSNDENLEIEAVLAKNFEGKLDPYDLIIWHGPGQNMNEKLKSEIQEVKKPFWYILPANSDNNLKDANVPFSTNFSRKTDNIFPSFNSNFSKFELSDETKSALNKFGPLKSPYGKVSVNSSTDVLFKQRLGSIVKDDPLLLFGKEGQEKFAITVGEGFWRWRLSNFQATNDTKAFDEIVRKTVQYLSVRTNTSKLRVDMPKTFFEDEEVNIKSRFYNDAYEPITTPSIKFTLKNEQEDKINYEFLPGKSQYSLSLGALDAGKYQWKAYTEFDGREYEKDGMFVVRKVELEALDTRANHNLLYQLSQLNEKGEFFRFSEREDFINSLKSMNFNTVAYESYKFKNLLDYKWLFFILVLSLSLEWFMRRYLGSY